MKDDIIQQIIKIEWGMFIAVRNIGGTASCQRDPKTFKIMRESQFVAWFEDVLKSYLEDLIKAVRDGRNLMAEKYARMMEYTSPLEYANIADMLPRINKKNLALIDKILKSLLIWENDLSKRFPYIRARGRPSYSSEDGQNITSIETYLRGELATYSLKTLMLYHNSISKQMSDNINGSEITLLYMVKAYGYKSLEEANKKLK